MPEARIDKWMWAARIFKTRTIAAEACKKGRISINGAQAKGVTGEILTAAHINDYNSFDKPETVVPQPFKDARIRKGVLTLTMPAKSIVTLELQ